jgi:DHA1 family bicyclomycin/chloramphenicol resistance-like MFS transporter
LHTTDAAAALTLSLFLAGFAVAPVAGGPLSDRFGRRPVLLGGCLIFAIAAIGSTFASTIELLLFFRLLQGIGAGGAAVLSMALIRDLFEGNEATG